MRMLVIGGTQFVGRHIVEEAMSHGHEIAVLHRGNTGAHLFPKAEHLLIDRNDASAVRDALRGRSFDATVDVSAYIPRQVRTLAEALGDRGGHHVYISTVSVYDEPARPGADESSPLLELEDKSTETVTNETYGALKAECERVAVASYPAERLSIVRPTYVVGPYDHTGRFTYWVERIHRGGDVLAPGPKESPIQLVDARDQAMLVVSLAERAVPGVFNSIGTPSPYTFGDMLEDIAGRVGPDGTRLVWADPAWLKERDVPMPLWPEGESLNIMAMSNTAALAAGLPTRPVADTVRDTWAWIEDLLADGESPYRTPPLSADREAELLTEWNGSAAAE
jgi:nucleoside-diphosphate-sugar epimerase